jgi:hypothetical protein
MELDAHKQVRHHRITRWQGDLAGLALPIAPRLVR